MGDFISRLSFPGRRIVFHSKSICCSKSVGIFVSLLKHVCILVKEHREFSLSFLSSRDCKSDDTRRQLMVIRHLCHLETASPMTRGDNIWSSATFVIQRWQVRWNAYTTYGHPPPLSPSDDKSDATWREHMVIRHLCHPETTSLMTRGENIWSSATFVI